VRDNDLIERMARAGYTRNAELTWRCPVSTAPSWEMTSEGIRTIWRNIMKQAFMAMEEEEELERR
jgi:hypothetical protein